MGFLRPAHGFRGLATWVSRGPLPHAPRPDSCKLRGLNSVGSEACPHALREALIHALRGLIHALRVHALRGSEFHGLG
ncbi:hypothetical protein AVEN_103655-1 [Araneus ventricosus]|uniref:Uncharacterized protein n=1 Tax=Araneus ventricosus TaxID=182803 RepID=A0A4Y2NQP1_ARAVE|nr:hypothetical protein AVEN_103655-1 [Araneus ventricosus]